MNASSQADHGAQLEGLAEERRATDRGGGRHQVEEAGRLAALLPLQEPEEEHHGADREAEDEPGQRRERPRAQVEIRRQRGQRSDHGRRDEELDRVGRARIDLGPAHALDQGPSHQPRQAHDREEEADRRAGAVELLDHGEDDAGDADHGADPLHRPQMLVEQEGGENGDEQRARTGEQCREPGGDAVVEREEDPDELSGLEQEADDDHLQHRPQVPRPLDSRNQGDRGHHQGRNAHSPEEDREPGRVPDRERADDEAAGPDGDHHGLGESKPRVGRLRGLAHL